MVNRIELHRLRQRHLPFVQLATVENISPHVAHHSSHPYLSVYCARTPPRHGWNVGSFSTDIVPWSIETNRGAPEESSRMQDWYGLRKPVSVVDVRKRDPPENYRNPIGSRMLLHNLRHPIAAQITCCWSWIGISRTPANFAGSILFGIRKSPGKCKNSGGKHKTSGPRSLDCGQAIIHQLAFESWRRNRWPATGEVIIMLN